MGGPFVGEGTYGGREVWRACAGEGLLLEVKRTEMKGRDRLVREGRAKRQQRSGIREKDSEREESEIYPCCITSPFLARIASNRSVTRDEMRLTISAAPLALTNHTARSTSTFLLNMSSNKLTPRAELGITE